MSRSQAPPPATPQADRRPPLWRRAASHLGGAFLLVFGVALGGLWFGGSSSDAPTSDPAEKKPAEDTVYTCSMHPQIRQAEPGKCPICGMDLIPVVDAPREDVSTGRVVLSERARTLAKLRTTVVRRRGESAAEVRLLGRLEQNESTLKTVTAWTGGRIDRLHVAVTGARVRAGQVIATLYSPEVFAAHQDLLVAKRQVDRLSGSVESARLAASQALEAARERLRLLGVPDDELARMEKAERPTQSVPVRSPFGGTVIERIATEGAYVTTGAPLYRVADLSTLWVQLDAYESDLSRLRVGQTVSVHVEAFADDVVEGKITFIDPTLDPRRRIARVRVEIKNRDGKLRPGMFAQAVVEAVVDAKVADEQGAPLVIPATAPLFTGKRSIVYVALEQGERVAYEPRTVRLGPKLGDHYPVVAGLNEGERIVSRGAFAIDADLQIRGGPSMMSAPDDLDSESPDAPIELGPAELKKLAPVVRAYLDVQKALAADDLPAAKRAASELEGAAQVKLDKPPEAASAWLAIAAPMRQHAGHLGHAASIEQARTVFEALSDAVAKLLLRFGNPTGDTLSVAHCSMAFGSKGASWVQSGETIDNAYFGEAMRSCGEIESTVAPGAHLDAKGSGR